MARILSLQEQNKIETCFGCGTNNHKGLHIKSYQEKDGESVCIWQAEPWYSSGRAGQLYGGIIASLMDCHSVNLAIYEAYKRENRKPGSQPLLQYVTANLEVSYIQPCPIGQQLCVRAKLIESKDRKTWIESEITCENIICAKGKVLAIAVN